MTAAPASDAEALSCATAGRYAGRWARSVARPSVDDDRSEPPPWFVDGFAGADLQRAALRGATVQPAAMVAVQALEDAAAAGLRIVLIEEDPGLIARLGEMLEGIGAGERVRVSSDPACAEPGEILLVEGAFASHVQRLAQRIGDEPALVRLAPLAARTLPWTALEPVVHLDSADVLLRFPREDFEKQARFAGPMADMPPHLRRVVEGCSNFLDDARHGWLLAWRQAQRASGPDAALATAIERMRVLLAGEERTTHILHVAGKTESVHILLSTPQPEHVEELDGALADGAAKPKPSKRKAAASAKPQAPAAPPSEPPAAPSAQTVDEPIAEPVEAVAEPSAESTGPIAEPPVESAEPVAEPPAESVEPAAELAPEPPLPHAPAPTDTVEPVDEPSPIDAPAAVPEPAEAATEPAAPAAEQPPEVAEPAAALDLFALASEPEPAPRGPDLAAFGDELHARHIGAKVPADDLLAGGGDAGLTPEQVRAALASLKRAGRVSYRSLDAEGAEVEFLAEARPSAPRPRKTRAPAPDVLGLFDDPEE